MMNERSAEPLLPLLNDVLKSTLSFLILIYPP